ncbi:MAG TPA: APC family permease [Thermohalobaculum sp.]|nr:APC family permease [Thermohalobaculum sp.]
MAAETTQPGLKRRLGFGLLTLYGVGVMVGAGIYVLVGAVAGQAGVWAPLAFVLAAIIAAPTGLSYAELTGRIPEAAGEAAYLRAATGQPLAAAAVGLAIEVVGVVSAAVVLQGGVGYLRAIVDLPEALLIVTIGSALGIAALIGVLESLMLAAVLTVIEVIGLLVVIGVGATGPVAIQPDIALSFSLVGIAAGGILAFFAFLGFEDMVNMVEETRDPARTVPRAIFAALAVTTILYVLVSWAAARVVPVDQLSESRQPLALVFETATGRSAGFLAMIAVAAALNGVLAQIVMSARVLYGLGRFLRPLRVFHHAHPRFGTPVLATLLATTVTVTLALTAPLLALAELTSAVLLLVFIAINGALIVLKQGGPPPVGVFVAPRWVPWAGAAGSGVALIWAVAS